MFTWSSHFQVLKVFLLKTVSNFYKMTYVSIKNYHVTPTNNEGRMYQTELQCKADEQHKTQCKTRTIPGQRQNRSWWQNQ